LRGVKKDLVFALFGSNFTKKVGLPRRVGETVRRRVNGWKKKNPTRFRHKRPGSWKKRGVLERLANFDEKTKPEVITRRTSGRRTTYLSCPSKPPPKTQIPGRRNKWGL